MADGERSLICSVLNRLFALPLQHVIETMRPLPIEPLAGVPRPVMGVAIIRGAVVPVVDLAWVLAEEESHSTRFVTVHADGRRVALAVDAVVGVRVIPTGSQHDLPPLLHGASLGAIATIGTLDADLLLVLRGSRLVPKTVWDALEADGASP